MYKITIKQGNMFNEKEADFVVNPSNTELILGSGVSMAIKRSCGYEIQKEMDKYKPIKQGEVIVTNCPKNPNYKNILHVAIMNYTKGRNKNPSLNTIKTALYNIEKLLTPNSKLVLPLMGCGVGGLEKEEVIKIYKEFFSKNIDFDVEVLIYGYSKEDYNLLENIFSATF